jgi:hypothetical protein
MLCFVNHCPNAAPSLSSRNTTILYPNDHAHAIYRHNSVYLDTMTKMPIHSLCSLLPLLSVELVVAPHRSICAISARRAYPKSSFQCFYHCHSCSSATLFPRSLPLMSRPTCQCRSRARYKWRRQRTRQVQPLQPARLHFQ